MANTHTETPAPELYGEEVHEEIETSHGTADEGLLASLGLNGQLFIFQFINFAIVAAIVWFMILKPLTKKMDDRKKMVDDSIDKAKEIETNLQMSQQKYQEKIDEAKVEANKVIASAKKEAEVMGEKMKLKTKEDIELLIDQAKRNIAIEKDEAMAEVRSEAASMITAAMEKILNKKIDQNEDAGLITDALKELKK